MDVLPNFQIIPVQKTCGKNFFFFDCTLIIFFPLPIPYKKRTVKIYRRPFLGSTIMSIIYQGKIDSSLPWITWNGIIKYLNPTRWTFEPYMSWTSTTFSFKLLRFHAAKNRQLTAVRKLPSLLWLKVQLVNVNLEIVKYYFENKECVYSFFIEFV